MHRWHGEKSFQRLFDGETWKINVLDATCKFGFSIVDRSSTDGKIMKKNLKDNEVSCMLKCDIASLILRQIIQNYENWFAVIGDL